MNIFMVCISSTFSIDLMLMLDAESFNYYGKFIPSEFSGGISHYQSVVVGLSRSVDVGCLQCLCAYADGIA